MISSGPRSPFHSPVFRRTGHSPALPERSSSFSFTQLPPIHDLLSPQSRPVVVQRPRGSTLPSYLSTDTTTFTSNSSRERPRMRRIGSAVSSSHEGDPYSDQDDENGSIMPGGVSLPPINDGSRQIHTFNGLPPIKTMLPSHRSPASSPQSIPRLSSSWSSNVPTLGSNGDHSDRFQPYSPPIGSQHKAFRMRTSPSPPTHVEDEYRHTTTTSLDDGFRRRQNIPKPSRSSLLSLTAPRQARNTPSESHNSGQRIREDVIMSSASTTPAPYPTTSAPSGRRDSHEDEKHSRQTTSGYSAPLYRYMSPGPESGPLGGSFELSETESMRLKPGETAGGKKRRSRATQEQLDLLNAVYQRTPFPTTVERNELANRLGMTPRSVQIWFQNKRQGAKHNESRRRELPPLVSNNRSGSPQMPNLVPLTLAATSPPSPRGFEARSMSYGAETRRGDNPESTGDLRGRARRRRMSVNDLLRQDARDETRPAVGSPRYTGRQRQEERE